MSEATAKKTDEDLQSIVKFAVTEAIDFIESDIAEQRNKAQRYASGAVDLGHEEGRSKVVATKIRDTIRVIVPNLMRVFLAHENPVEFVPRKPADVEAAEQATKYISMEFERLDGFRQLNDAFIDAVTKKTGFIKAYWDEKEEITHHQFTNLTDDQLTLLLDEQDIEITEQESEMTQVKDPTTGELVEGMLHTLHLTRTATTGCIVMQVIPPEDFFIDSGATCLDDAYIYGHQCEMRVTDLVAMGFPFEEVVEMGSIHADESDTSEKYEREDYTDDSDAMLADPAMKLVTVTEAYMKVDIEGNGEAVMHKFLLAGKEYKILEKEPWTGHCIAVFESDPEPHLFFGHSIPDILYDEQDAATSMLRGILDNIALTNEPRTEVNDDIINMDDMLNNEIGGIVRSKAIGQGINPLVVEFIAGSTLPAVMYFDQQIEAKTGINSVTSGLNGDELTNQTATAVNAQVKAGANQLEAVARHLGQGMKDLFKIMLDLLIENTDEPVLMRLSGQNFVEMDPRSWDTKMDMRVNVGLGNGRDGEKQVALGQALQLQIQMMQMQIPNLPEAMHNTVADMLAISGVRNADRYFPPAEPQQPGQEQQGGQQQQGGDPAQAIIQSEQIKAQASQQEKMMDLQFKMAEMMKKDDLERDKMAQGLMVDFAKILGQYGVQVDIAGIKGEQEKERAMMQPPQPGPGQAANGPM